MFRTLRRILVLGALSAAVTKLWPVVEARLPAAKAAAQKARERMSAATRPAAPDDAPAAVDDTHDLGRTAIHP